MKSLRQYLSGYSTTFAVYLFTNCNHILCAFADLFFLFMAQSEKTYLKYLMAEQSIWDYCQAKQQTTINIATIFLIKILSRPPKTVKNEFDNFIERAFLFCAPNLAFVCRENTFSCQISIANNTRRFSLLVA